MWLNMSALRTQADANLYSTDQSRLPVYVVTSSHLPSNNIPLLCWVCTCAEYVQSCTQVSDCYPCRFSLFDHYAALFSLSSFCAIPKSSSLSSIYYFFSIAVSYMRLEQFSWSLPCRSSFIVIGYVFFTSCVGRPVNTKEKAKMN